MRSPLSVVVVVAVSDPRDLPFVCCAFAAFERRVKLRGREPSRRRKNQPEAKNPVYWSVLYEVLQHALVLYASFSLFSFETTIQIFLLLCKQHKFKETQKNAKALSKKKNLEHDDVREVFSILIQFHTLTKLRYAFFGRSAGNDFNIGNVRVYVAYVYRIRETEGEQKL